MPYSASENKDVVKRWYSELKPWSVVDLGPGAGTYSDLLRPLDNGVASWSAVEAWGPYVNQFNLTQKYNHVVVADIRYVDLRLVDPRPDLVIMGDVLEHLPRGDAENLMGDIQSWTKNLVVSLPIVHYPQGSYEGNWFETHHHHWSHEEVLEFLGEGVVDSVRGPMLGYYLWSQDVA